MGSSAVTEQQVKKAATKRSKERKGSQGPKIIAVGGGKGGVGKSLVSSGIATALAQSGSTTYCIDLDLGGANLHTFFGLKNTTSGIGDFLYRPHSKELSDYAEDTGVKNLKLVAGGGFIPGIANLYYFQKLKVIRAVKRLEADYVVMDLGAGTSYNVVDFFSITRSGIVVINPEPTSMLNGYEFIKNVLFRIFSRSFKKGSVALDIIETHKFGGEDGKGSRVSLLMEEMERHDPHAAVTLKEICSRFRPGIVMNMTSSSEQARQLAANLAAICSKFLSIKISYAGMVPADPQVKVCLVGLKNLLETSAESSAAKAIRELAKRCAAEHFVSGEDLSRAEEVEDSASDGQGQETLGSDGTGELSLLLERFFSVLKEDAAVKDMETGSRSGPQQAFSVADPSAFLDLQPRRDPDWFRPMFSTERRYRGQEIDIPERPSGALSLIVALSDLEEELQSDGPGGNGNGSGMDRKRELAHAWFDCGCLFLKGGQAASAARAFSKALGLAPSDAVIMGNLAACSILSGSHLEAEKMLRELCRGDSAPAEALFNLGLCLFMKGDYEGASAELSRLAGRPDAPARLYPLLSEALYHAGMVQDAVRALDMWEQSLNAQKGEASAGEQRVQILPYILFNKALCHMASDDYGMAAGHLNRLLKHFPLDGQAHAALGICLSKQGRLEEAEEHLSRAVSLRPADLALRAARASLLFSMSKLDLAFEDAEAIARLRPANPGYRQLLEAMKNSI